jgi:sigma-E factor negative regulatory protein RseC
MQVEGIVTRLDGSRAFVQIQRSGGCGRCQEAGGCQSGSLADPLGKRCQEYAIENPDDAQPGSRVAVEVPDGATLIAALLAYGIPVAGLLVGAAIAYARFRSDLGTLAGAALGLGAAITMVRVFRLKSFARLAQPKIVRILG